MKKDVIEIAYQCSLYFGKNIIVKINSQGQARFRNINRIPITPPSLKVRAVNKSDVTWLYDYFKTKYKEHHNMSFPSASYAIDVSLLKTKVMDWFYENGYHLKDMIDFVDWCFKENQAKELSWLPYNLSKYVSRVMIGKRTYAVTPRKQGKTAEFKKLLLKETFEYYGSGFFDDKLNKKQYFLGLKWRKKKLNKEEIDRVEGWQKKRYGTQVVTKLQQWKKEFDEIETKLNFKEMFYELEAERNSRTVVEIKEYYNGILNGD